MSETIQQTAPLGELVLAGQAVKVVDEHGILHDALCEQNWSDGDTRPSTCINVVFVTADHKKGDTFGFQKEHLSSCTHASLQTAPGRYWYIDQKYARPQDVRGEAGRMIADGKAQAHAEWLEQCRQREQKRKAAEGKV